VAALVTGTAAPAGPRDRHRRSRRPSWPAPPLPSALVTRTAPPPRLTCAFLDL